MPRWAVRVYHFWPGELSTGEATFTISNSTANLYIRSVPFMEDAVFKSGQPWPLLATHDNDYGTIASGDASEWRGPQIVTGATPPVAPAAFDGTATIVFGQTGDLKANAATAGTATLTFGQSGTLKGGATLAGSTTITFGQTGDFTAGAGAAIFAGSAAIAFDATATFVAGAGGAAADFAGSTAIQFGQTGNLSGGSGFQGATTIVFDATGIFTSLAPGDVAFQGSTHIQFDATATFTAGLPAPVVEGPRGAWISDERVEREREKRWKRQRKAEEELRQTLTAQVKGEHLIKAREAVELLLLEAPAIDYGLIALREEIQRMLAGEWQRARVEAALRFMALQMAEEEAAAEEEAGMVALLMAI